MTDKLIDIAVMAISIVILCSVTLIDVIVPAVIAWKFVSWILQ